MPLFCLVSKRINSDEIKSEERKNQVNLHGGKNFQKYVKKKNNRGRFQFRLWEGYLIQRDCVVSSASLILNICKILFQDQQDVEKLAAEKVKKSSSKEKQHGEEEKTEMDGGDEDMIVVDGEKIDTQTVERGVESSFHTQMDKLSLEMADVDIEKLRRELEEELALMTPKEKGEEHEQVWDRMM